MSKRLTPIQLEAAALLVREQCLDVRAFIVDPALLHKSGKWASVTE
jgi:hypothetical protein